MHDWLVTAFPFLSDSATNPSSSTLVVVAIVTAMGLVLAAALPVLLATREREPRAARREDRMQRKLDWRDRYIENLEALAWQHGTDPRTVKPEDEP